MYRIILLLVFICFLGLIYWRYKKGYINVKAFQSMYSHYMNSFKEHIRFRNGDVLYSIRVITYQLTLLFVIVMALSSFLPVLILGGHLSGLPLILHVTFAPLFCVVFAIFVIFWAHSQRFKDKDLQYVKDLKEKKKINEMDESYFWRRIYFWSSIVLVIPMILSIVLSMYTFFGTYGQEILLEIHRYSTLLFSIIIAIHIIFIPKLNQKT